MVHVMLYNRVLSAAVAVFDISCISFSLFYERHKAFEYNWFWECWNEFVSTVFVTIWEKNNNNNNNNKKSECFLTWYIWQTGKKEFKAFYGETEQLWNKFDDSVLMFAIVFTQNILSFFSVAPSLVTHSLILFDLRQITKSPDSDAFHWVCIQ